MAIAVPFLMTATGASAAIAGAIGISGITAGVVSTVTSLVFQVSGINDKINKAASKVFGEDLVGFANIAGAVYGAVNGGFDIGKAGEAGAGAVSSIDPSSANYVSAADAASDAFSAANSAAGGSLVSDGMGGIFNAPGTAGATIDALSRDGLSNANPYTPDGGFNLEEMAGGKGVNLLDMDTPLNTDMKVFEEAASGATRTQGATGQVSAAPDASASKYSLASTPNAAAQTAAGANATSSGLGVRPSPNSGLGVRIPANALTPPASGNVFTRMLGGLSEKERLGLLQGAGQAVTGYMTSREAAKKSAAEMAWAKERYYNSAPSVRVVG